MSTPRTPKSPLFTRNALTLLALASIGAGYASMKWQTVRQRQVAAGQKRLAEQAGKTGAAAGDAGGGEQKVVRGDYGVKVHRSGGGI